MVIRRCGLAFVKEKYQRDFRLHTDQANPSLDFNKIKIGKNTITGEIVSLIKDYRNSPGRKYDKEAVKRAIERHDVRELRKISDYFFETSGIYSRLCRYMAYLYRYD